MLRYLSNLFTPTSSEIVPAVEYTTDEKWKNIHVLEENALLMVDSNGLVYRCIDDKWVADPTIKDVRINY